jgi:hypothetical protein
LPPILRNDRQLDKASKEDCDMPGPLNTTEPKKLEYILDKLSQERNAFWRRRNYNRKIAWVYALAAMLLSATSTVVLGMGKIIDIPSLQVVALVASGLATVVAATEAVFSHRKLWHLNNIAMAALDKLDRQLQVRMADSKVIISSEIDTFFTRLDEILSDIDQKWVDTYAVK